MLLELQASTAQTKTYKNILIYIARAAVASFAGQRTTD